MRNNRTLHILPVLLVCLLFIGGIAHAQSVTELRQKMDEARKFVKAEEKEHEVANDRLNEMVGNFVTLHANLVNIKISAIPATSTWEFAAAFTQIVEALTKANLLTSAMRTMLTNIEAQRDICNTRWADVLLAQTAYEDAIDAFNAKVSPSEQVKTVEVPQAPSVAPLYLCPGPCSTPFTTKVLATTSHKVFCDIEPHKGSGYSYYSCPPDYPKDCPKKIFHNVACRGGCGTMFARNGATSIPKDGEHYKGVCEGFDIPESYIKMFGKSSKLVDCPGRFYNCNGQTSATDCPYKKAHVKKGSSSKSASLSGSSSAKAGSSYRIDLTTTAPYRYMYWYVRDPGQSGRGRLVRSVSGSRRSYTASLSYAFPSSASAGDYVITALVRSVDGSESEVSHTVRVESSVRQTRVVKKDVTPVSQPTDTTTKEKETTPTSTTQKKTNPPLTTPKETTPKETQPKETTPKQTRPTATCSYGHTYYTDGANASKRKAYHQDRTCTRCGQIYQNCRNIGSVCQNRYLHTEDPSAAPKPKPKPTTPTNNNNGGNSNNNNGGNQNNGNNGNNNNVPTSPSKPTPTYHACGIHESSVSGDHSLQASCSQTNSNGDRCTVTNFYACQSHTHRYPAPKKPDPPPKPKSACPADSWSKCGGSTSHAATCSAGHSYYTCASQAWHKDRTCTRCSQTYQDCTNSASACQGSKWHTDKAIAKIKCGASGWTSCTTSVSSKTEHRRTCRENHQYWTCGTAVEWHKTRTCTRCGWAYSNCGNSATACQGKRWHTGG